MPHSPLSAGIIQQGLATKIFGQTVYYVEQIGSTNVELKALAAEGAPEGTLYITDEQVAGRGRFNRRWHAPPGSSLLMSLLFRPTFLAPTQTSHLTMLCSLAAIEAIEAITGIQIGIKWPNDLVYEGQKLAGILTEIGYVGSELAWVVVGMGLNVNVDFMAAAAPTTPEDRPLAATATSLQMILGEPVSRSTLLRAYLLRVEDQYTMLRRGYSPQPAWAERLTTLGETISVSSSESTRHGLAEAVDENGALLVRWPDGQLERVIAGDVTLR
jgi:BirA family biotin operon repressor/biotin-[acetyl-CoA-carboxylase] ligase